MEALVHKELSEELNSLQEKVFADGIPVLIAFEGSSGRVINRVMSEIIRCIEPRGVSYHHFSPRDGVCTREFFDFLEASPAKGMFSLYDRSWYSHEINRYKDEDYVVDVAAKCNAFERYLSNNGVLVIKVLLDASSQVIRTMGDDFTRTTQTRSFLSADKIDSVKFKAVMEEGLFKMTDSAYAPWDRVKVETVEDTVNDAVSRINARLKDRLEKGPKKSDSKMPTGYPNPRIGMELDVKCNGCRDDLVEYSDKLTELQTLLAASGRALVIGFEGWDAAGKGTTIKHLTHALSPRGYAVHQVKAPSPAENEHTYFWRFCQSLPRTGHITIYDRKWYGRMMVEPIEGFCTEDEYIRSASEINAMEKAMSDGGMIVMKFWIDITKDEQLERFKERETEPLKNWKITEDDWRNRSKWDVYDKYVNRMIEATNTEYAPWTVIPANNKKVARSMTLKAVVDRLIKELQVDRMTCLI